jgi:uncharacterized membrane protein YczE
MPGADPLKNRLQISGILLIIGLLIEAACLFSPRPIAFVIFVGVGGFLMFAGMALYLFSLVSIPANE